MVATGVPCGDVRADRDLMWKSPPGYDPLWVWRPKTWLLATGWRRAGTISARDVPPEA